ncbi:C40 family peptidase [Sporosarcina sp. ACRSL]|uniref:C40 family peptidase n=1 Tax=Sporosarcina sp. ACRSL TaxID=2918215 RepID=UPI001EF5D3BE|nr:C40 family peptidase [Sporosarcina sp. ACRSL]MCG7344190.1 C40 family peptidase [Sporosarcina sp. ACRSL]
MQKKIAVFIMIVCLFTTFHHTSAATESKELSNRKTDTVQYAISVPVTNVWRLPTKTRKIDAISIAAKPDMAKWTKGLTVAEKNGLIGRTDTQALYGDRVEVLKSSGNWHYIAVTDQFNKGQAKGYEGWVPKAHVKAYSPPSGNNSEIAIVTAKIASLYNEPKLNDKYKFIDISYTTILEVVKEERDWLQVQTKTDGVKYVRKKDVKVYADFESIPKPTQQDLVDSAKQYVGLPYLWAGVSAYGFDCSGLVYSVYKNHGILIPRDSSVQATYGTAVKRKDLQPGDLMFFAHNKGKGNVYHVSMYIGDGKMVHAPNSSKKVEIVSINLGTYKTNYAGARRYLK